MFKYKFPFLKSVIRCHIRCFLLILLLLTASSAFANDLIVGYYPCWMTATLPARDIQFENLTHIIHAFAWPESDGSISTAYGLIYPELNEAAHNAGKKILISLGGWGNSGGFAPMAADSATRATFIGNLMDFMNDNNYDGVDLDWESPANTTQKNNLTLLVKELHEKFDEVDDSLLLTMAVGTGSYSGQHFDYESMIEYIDWFAMMAYDFHGGWSNHAGHNAPLYQPPGENDGSGYDGMQYLHVTRGIPKNKILFGMPFYGKHFYASELYGPATDGNTTYLYSEIARKFAAGGWVYHWDDFSKVPYLLNTYNTRFITYDDTVSIRFKCEFAKDNKLLGVMIWALGQDVLDDTQPLLETVGKTMRGQTGVSTPANQIVRKIELFENYPNPFNPTTTIQFSLDKSLQVRLSIYNNSGQLVQVLLNSMVNGGVHTVKWDANGLSTGLYFYKLEAGSFCEMKKMLFVK